MNQPKHFWANVRSISQHVGYTDRKTGHIKVPSIRSIAEALADLDLDSHHIIDRQGGATEFGRTLASYFRYRASIIRKSVEPFLLDSAQAGRLFKKVAAKCKSSRAIPMNKQTGDKKQAAFLTAMVNLLIEANIKSADCDYDPRELTTFTHRGAPLRTLARRVDGAFPSTVNPIAVWEIKEYYYTTTFGSRVADGVYETLLDGLELEELRKAKNVDCKHYLVIDARYTWWDCGKSYLCRIVDMLHMGYVDEVIVGRQVVTRIPILAREWLTLYRRRVRLGAKVRRGAAT